MNMKKSSSLRRTHVAIVLFLATLLSCSAQSAGPGISSAAIVTNDASTTVAAPAGYRLVWSDEFSHDPDGLPDPTKWIYEEGFVRNNEAQYYTKERKENARVENGRLVIEARKEPFPNPSHKGPAVARYTSAALETFGKAEWQYGRVEVRAKLPAGGGVWPAIWTLGANVHQREVGWPRCGEIDIMENIGREPGIIHGTIHYFGNGRRQSAGSRIQVDHPESSFNVYAAEWTPDHLDLSVNGETYVRFDVRNADNDGANPFRKPQFLILNLALGGNWGGSIDDSIFPQRMTVDYVRVYQKN